MGGLLLRRGTDGQVLYRVPTRSSSSSLWGNPGVSARPRDGYGPGLEHLTSTQRELGYMASKFGRAALLVGAAAVAAGVVLKREKVAGLVSSGSSSGASGDGSASAPAA